MKQQSNNQQLSASPNRKRWIAVIALLFVIAAAVTAFFLMRGSRGSLLAGRPVPEPSGEFSAPDSNIASSGFALQPGDVMIEISPDKLANAHLKIEAAVSQPNVSMPDAGVRTTGTVESNAYKETPVLPIAGGIVREVGAQLGDKVARGQRLAVIFSTELADAQADYLKMQAELEKHHQRFRRTEQLVEIGAASREDFEAVSAEYKIEQVKLAAMKQKLTLLGMKTKQMDEMNKTEQVSSLIAVEAPAPGTILSRTVNIGEVVMTGKELFRVADLSRVWVIGQIYEKDFAAVRVGTAAAITTAAYPGNNFNGRVSYIAPQVDAQTRTSQVRVEVANPGEMLRLGMFVDVSFGGASAATGGQTVAAVPRAALQFIGGKQVVYVATDKPGAFAQRNVAAGDDMNGLVPISSGLAAGDRVVTEGSFLLRAESLKLNPAQLNAANEAQPRATQPATNEAAPPKEPKENAAKIQTVNVALTEKGYRPNSVKLRKDVPARLVFTRKVEGGCGTEVLITDYGIKRELPFNQPVTIEFTPNKTGEVKFACGMDMLKGKLIVR
ncbi:MAG: efflux RND transporter periplasmic adaptor subunit [Blastocatellia bacterium]